MMRANTGASNDGDRDNEKASAPRASYPRAGRPEAGALKLETKIILPSTAPQWKHATPRMPPGGTPAPSAAAQLRAAATAAKPPPQRPKVKSPLGKREKKKRQQREESEDDEPTEEELNEAAETRACYSLKFYGGLEPSPANKGFYQLDSVKFKREETGKHRLHVAPGDWVVAAVDRYVSENLPPVVDLEVARIGEVLLDDHGQVWFGVWWAWQWNSIFTDTSGPEAPKNAKRTIYMQQNLCRNGSHYVRSPEGKWTDMLPWHAVIRKAMVIHTSELSNEQKPRFDYAYDRQFDHTVWRLTDVGRIGMDGKPVEVPRKRLQPKDLTMIDTFAGLGTVALAARHCGMKPLWAVESDFYAFSACNANLDYTLRIDHQEDLAAFIKGIKARAPGYPRRGEVGVLHLSPPCQSLSQANRHSDMRKVHDVLLHLLAQCVEVVTLLKPKFVTLEEVVDFLCKTLINDLTLGKNGGSTTVRPLLHFLAPLMDLGYQAEVCVLNSVYYGTPQVRKRLFVFLAAPGYELPSAPAAMYHYNDKFRKTDAKRRDSMTWDTIYVTSRGYQGLKHQGDAPQLNVTQAEALQEAEALQALEQSKGEDAEEFDGDEGVDRDQVVNSDNPLNLPPAVTAAEAIGDLPEPRLNELQNTSAKRNVPIRYPQRTPHSRFAGFMRKPFAVKQVESLAVNDQTLPQSHGVFRKDGQSVVGSQLARCQRRMVLPHEAGMSEEKRIALKKKPMVAPSQPFGTICATIDEANPRGNMHYNGARLLTLAERKRIQGIPDDTQLCGDTRDALLQVGNAVPFPLGCAVMNAVMRAATGKPPPNSLPNLSGDFVPQPVAKLEPAAVGGRATPEVALGVGRGTPEVALGVERLQSPSSELETDGLDATVWKALQGKGSGVASKGKGVTGGGEQKPQKRQRGLPVIISLSPESSMKERQARRDKRSKLVEESLASLKTEDSTSEARAGSVNPRSARGASQQRPSAAAAKALKNERVAQLQREASRPRGLKRIRAESIDDEGSCCEATTRSPAPAPTSGTSLRSLLEPVFRPSVVPQARGPMSDLANGPAAGVSRARPQGDAAAQAPTPQRDSQTQDASPGSQRPQGVTARWFLADAAAPAPVPANETTAGGARPQSAAGNAANGGQETPARVDAATPGKTAGGTSRRSASKGEAGSGRRKTPSHVPHHQLGLLGRGSLTPPTAGKSRPSMATASPAEHAGVRPSGGKSAGRVGGGHPSALGTGASPPQNGFAAGGVGAHRDGGAAVGGENRAGVTLAAEVGRGNGILSPEQTQSARKDPFGIAGLRSPPKAKGPARQLQQQATLLSPDGSSPLRSSPVEPSSGGKGPQHSHAGHGPGTGGRGPSGGASLGLGPGWLPVRRDLGGTSAGKQPSAGVSMTQRIGGEAAHAQARRTSPVAAVQVGPTRQPSCSVELIGEKAAKPTESSAQTDNAVIDLCGLSDDD